MKFSDYKKYYEDSINHAKEFFFHDADERDFNIFQYEETFNSTSLGRIGVVSGRAMTTTLTVCVIYEAVAAVYRAGRFDYTCVVNPNFLTYWNRKKLPSYSNRNLLTIIEDKDPVNNLY